MRMGWEMIKSKNGVMPLGGGEDLDENVRFLRGKLHATQRQDGGSLPRHRCQKSSWKELLSLWHAALPEWASKRYAQKDYTCWGYSLPSLGFVKGVREELLSFRGRRPEQASPW